MKWQTEPEKKYGGEDYMAKQQRLHKEKQAQKGNNNMKITIDEKTTRRLAEALTRYFFIGLGIGILVGGAITALIFYVVL